MSTPENPPAFPVNTANLGGEGAHQPDSGMTLRDYFAAKVIPECLRNTARAVNEGDACFDEADIPERAATDAYIVADAMLRARTRAGEEGR